MESENEKTEEGTNAVDSVASVFAKSSSGSSESSASEIVRYDAKKRRRHSPPKEHFHIPSFLSKVYEMNYLCNVPGFEDTDDNTIVAAFAIIRHFKNGISKQKCDKDACMLSKKVCNEFKTQSIPLLSMHRIQERRTRVMEEEIRMNLFAFVDLCADQVSAQYDIHRYRTKHHEISTKHGKTLACCNRPVPSFWS